MVIDDGDGDDDGDDDDGDDDDDNGDGDDDGDDDDDDGDDYKCFDYYNYHDMLFVMGRKSERTSLSHYHSDLSYSHDGNYLCDCCTLSAMAIVD